MPLVGIYPIKDPKAIVWPDAEFPASAQRNRLLQRLAKGGVRTIDCEPRRLGVELVNRYRALKRSGAI